MSSTKLRCDGKIWEDRATREAVSAGLSPVAVLAGVRDREHTTARWLAWRGLRDDGYSCHSVAKSSGFDPSAVRNAYITNVLPYNPENCANNLTGSRAHNFIDIIGMRFGLLTVISRAANRLGLVYWECLCTCGATKTVRSRRLRSGETKTCGCRGRN